MFEDVTGKTKIGRGSIVKSKKNGEVYELGDFVIQAGGFEILYKGQTHRSTGVLLFVRPEDLLLNYQVKVG
ncbi:MAG: hypothetical protein ACKOXB_10185 [Flavobacteriales bacterium]